MKKDIDKKITEKKHPWLGKVFRDKSGGAGYWMVMKVQGALVTISPLFWAEAIVYFTKPERTFRNDYEEVTNPPPLPIIMARYDHEYMRRLNRI